MGNDRGNERSVDDLFMQTKREAVHREVSDDYWYPQNRNQRAISATSVKRDSKYNTIWSDTESNATRVIYVLAYGLGTGFSDVLSSTRDTLWITLTFVVVLVVIAFLKRFLDNLSLNLTPILENVKVENESLREASKKDEWVIEAHETLDFAEAIVLWFLGTTISGWISRSDIITNAHPVQLGLIPIVIVIIFTIMRRTFHGRELYENRRD